MRWAHIVRVWVYSLAVPAVALALGLLAVGAALATTRWFDSFLTVGGIFAGPLVLVAALIWWRSAIRHYLRMPHGWFIVVLLAVLGALLVLGVLTTAMGMLFQ